MSINKLFITTAIAAIGVSSVATTANAQSSRYGGADVHTYESGANCQVNPCAPVAAPAQSSRYGGQAQQAPVYADCAQMAACGPQVMAQPTTVYTQPAAPVYQQPQPQYVQQAQMAPVNCPAGTTAQSDGTCLQTSSTSTYSGTTSYGSTSSYGGYDVVIDTPPVAPAMPVNCPAGTTAQPDGTCLQGSSYSSTYGSTSSYSDTVTLPETHNSGAVYSGDASASTYGYTSDGAYTATDYRPMRK